MILGVGIDLIEVDRFRNHEVEVIGGPFSHAELEYCFSKRTPERHLAGRFAAKEAFLKALGSGALTTGEFAEIEVVNGSAGDPALQLSGGVAERAAKLNVAKIHLSLTHTATTAAAVVVLEG